MAGTAADGDPAITEESSYPPISDFALIADSNSAALVSRAGSVDWCCIQRLDAGSCFGRLLDWERGGFCSLSAPEGESSRRYLDRTLVLETTFRTAGGTAKLYDFFALPTSRERYPYRQLIRILEVVRGRVQLDLEIAPRFDYGSLRPWIRQEGVRLYSAIGGNHGLLISSDAEIKPNDDYTLKAQIDLHAGERVRLSTLSVPPQRLDYDPPEAAEPGELDQRLEETIGYWHD